MKINEEVNVRVQGTLPEQDYAKFIASLQLFLKPYGLTATIEDIDN